MAKPSKDKKRLTLDGVDLWYDEYSDCLRLSIFDRDLGRPMRLSVPTGRETEAVLRELLASKGMATGYMKVSEDDLVARELADRHDPHSEKVLIEAINAALPGRLGLDFAGMQRLDASHSHRIAVSSWVYRTGASTDWREYNRYASDIIAELRKRDRPAGGLAVVAMGELDDDGIERIGSAGHLGLRIWESSVKPKRGMRNDWTIDAYARMVVMPAVRQMVRHDDVHLHWYGILTRSGDGPLVYEIRVSGEVSALIYERSVQNRLAEHLGVQRVAAGSWQPTNPASRTAMQGVSMHSIVFGDDWDQHEPNWISSQGGPPDRFAILNG